MKPFKGPKKDIPLSVEVKNNQLIIRIGIRTLAWSAEHSPLLEKPDASGYLVQVSDAKVFAKEVANKLFAEDEIGNSLINTAFDKAILDAYGDGCEGIIYDELYLEQHL